MATYTVSIPKTVSVAFEVEAKSEDEAIALAFDDERMPSSVLCAQCSGWGQDYSVSESDWDDEEATAEMNPNP